MKDIVENKKFVREQLKQFYDKLDIDKGFSIEERLGDVKEYYSEEEYLKLLDEYKSRGGKDVFLYLYIDGIMDDIMKYTKVIDIKPNFIVYINPLYNSAYYGNGNFIRFDAGLCWFIHHVADIFAIWLPRIANGEMCTDDCKKLISSICDLVIQLRKQKIHEILQTKIEIEQYKLAGYLEYAFALFLCMHEITHMVKQHSTGDEIINFANEIEADRTAFRYAFEILEKKHHDNRMLIVAIIIYLHVFQLVEDRKLENGHPSSYIRLKYLIDEFLYHEYVLKGNNPLIDKLICPAEITYSLNHINNFMDDFCPICEKIIGDIEGMPNE